MNDPLNLSMFRAYDIRTPSARLDDELARRLARAEAVYFRDVLGVDEVLVAHDARLSGPRYLSIGVEAFREAGLDVALLPGVSSTCGFYHAAAQRAGAAAVMFGASHNPAGDTGQKLLAPGARPIARGIGPEGGLDRIRALYESGAARGSARRGRVRPLETMDEYVRESMALAEVEPGSLRATRVLHDYVHGAAGREMMRAFELAGAELEPLHFAPDGRFPLGAPNPVKPDVIREGLDALRRGDFLFGAFFDGDGDRIDFYRGDGTYVSSSFVYAAILPEIRRRFAGAGWGVFADLKCNPLAVIEMAGSGVAVDVIRNGHSQIKQTMFDDPSRFGAVEESAHFYEAFPGPGGARCCTENTLYVALLVARVWRDQPERFDRLIEIERTSVRLREWGYKFPTDAARAKALEAVERHFAARGASVFHRMRNGMDLEATLMRRGLPLEIAPGARLPDDWLQVCQRVSQSENGLARWEVCGARAEEVAEAKRAIADCARRCGAGEEYRG